MRAQRRAILCCLIALLLLGSSGCAANEGYSAKIRRWSVRGIGAVGALALHEACHAALGAALGADISAQWEGAGLNLGFANLSPGGHKAVAIIGNVCTGLLAEILVDTGQHKRSDLAWGAAAFHAGNAFGYSFAPYGDRAHWTGSGGSDAAWQSVHVLHASRIGAQLAWDAGVGSYVIRMFQGPPPLPPDLPSVSEPAPEPPTA
jgi:hypothetical protein